MQHRRPGPKQKPTYHRGCMSSATVSTIECSCKLQHNNDTLRKQPQAPETTKNHPPDSVPKKNIRPGQPPTHNHELRRLKTALPRVQTPHDRPARGHHRRPRQRRRPLPLGSHDPRARGNPLRGRRVPRRAQIPKGLPTHAADDEVPVRHLAPEW